MSEILFTFHVLRRACCPPIPWRVACFDQKDQKKAQKKDTPSKKAKAPPVKKHQSGMSPEIYDTIVARIAKGDTCTMCERAERAAHVCRDAAASERGQ